MQIKWLKAYQRLSVNEDIDLGGRKDKRTCRNYLVIECLLF